MSTEQYHVPKNGNGKINVLSWLVATFMLMIQIVSAVWIISAMNAAIENLKAQVSAVVDVQKTQQSELNEHELDIKLIQQGVSHVR